MRTKRYMEALEYARELHKDQKRKSTDIPYFTHLLDVAGLVIRHGGTEDQAIAALLHDAIEDQGDKTSRAEIGARFGEKAAQMVIHCTKDKTVKGWHERQGAYLAHLKEIPNEVMLIVLADKLSNLKDIVRDYAVFGEAVWERFTLKRNTIDQYRDYAKVFRGWAYTDDAMLRLELEFSELIKELVLGLAA